MASNQPHTKRDVGGQGGGSKQEGGDKSAATPRKSDQDKAAKPSPAGTGDKAGAARK